MKIEAGKYYRTRDGRKVLVRENDSGSGDYPWMHDCGKGWYHALDAQGKSCIGEYKSDIIEEWSETMMEPSNQAHEILTSAAEHLSGRASIYDVPDGERSMAKTVDVFNLHHGTQLTEAQGWHFMQILKDVRLFTRAAYHADSAEDCVAYAALKAEAKANEG